MVNRLLGWRKFPSREGSFGDRGLDLLGGICKRLRQTYLIGVLSLFACPGKSAGRLATIRNGLPHEIEIDFEVLSP